MAASKKHRPVLDPLSVPRCKVCADHTDARCSGCKQPICRRHNAAPASTFTLSCWECCCASVQPQPKTDPSRLQAHGSAMRAPNQ